MWDHLLFNHVEALSVVHYLCRIASSFVRGEGDVFKTENTLSKSKCWEDPIMHQKQEIMLKLAEIEESLNQLEQNLYDRIRIEKQDRVDSFHIEVQKVENQLDRCEEIRDIRRPTPSFAV